MFTDFTPAAAATALAITLLGAFKYATKKDWESLFTQIAGWITGVTVVLLASATQFATGIAVGSQSLAGLSIASQIFLGLTVGSSGGVVYKIIKAVETPSVVTTANPVVPEPGLPADPPSDPNAYFDSMPRVNDAVRTSNTSHGHVKTAWNAKAADTIDKSEAKLANSRKSRAKKPQTAHR